MQYYWDSGDSDSRTKYASVERRMYGIIKEGEVVSTKQKEWAWQK